MEESARDNAIQKQTGHTLGYPPRHASGFTQAYLVALAHAPARDDVHEVVCLLDLGLVPVFPRRASAGAKSSIAKNNEKAKLTRR